MLLLAASIVNGERATLRGGIRTLKHSRRTQFDAYTSYTIAPEPAEPETMPDPRPRETEFNIQDEEKEWIEKEEEEQADVGESTEANQPSRTIAPQVLSEGNGKELLGDEEEDKFNKITEKLFFIGIGAACTIIILCVCWMFRSSKRPRTRVRPSKVNKATANDHETTSRTNDSDSSQSPIFVIETDGIVMAGNPEIDVDHPTKEEGTNDSNNGGESKFQPSMYTGSMYTGSAYTGSIAMSRISGLSNSVFEDSDADCWSADSMDVGQWLSGYE